MSGVRDFPPLTGHITYDPDTLMRSLVKMNERQNIDLMNAVTVPATGDEITLFDVSASVTGKATLAVLATGIVNLTGPITSVGNATSVAAQTGTGSIFVMQASPTLTTPNIGVATGTSLQAIIGNVTPAAGSFTTLSASGQITSTVATGAAPFVVASTTLVANLSVATSAACTGNAATVTTNANLTGPITSAGNATSIASQTGTGTKFVVDTSPTLVTPILGVAAATSINFGQTALSYYGEGTWTPIDSSGASLSLSGAAGVYRRIGTLCVATGTFTFPITVDGSNNSIGGFPFSATTGQHGGEVVYSSTATALRFIKGVSSTVGSFLTSTAVLLTNAQLSAAGNQIQAAYQTT